MTGDLTQRLDVVAILALAGVCLLVAAVNAVRGRRRQRWVDGVRALLDIETLDPAARAQVLAACVLSLAHTGPMHLRLALHKVGLLAEALAGTAPLDGRLATLPADVREQMDDPERAALQALSDLHATLSLELDAAVGDLHQMLDVDDDARPAARWIAHCDAWLAHAQWRRDNPTDSYARFVLSLQGRAGALRTADVPHRLLPVVEPEKADQVLFAADLALLRHETPDQEQA